MNNQDRVELLEPTPYHQELSVGDTGIVVSGWKTTLVGVTWDKDGKTRVVRKKRLKVLNAL